MTGSRRLAWLSATDGSGVTDAQAVLTVRTDGAEGPATMAGDTSSCGRRGRRREASRLPCVRGQPAGRPRRPWPCLQRAMSFSSDGNPVVTVKNGRT
jgi:hypothetical protein